MKTPINYNGFLKMTTNESPPDNWPKLLKALWYDATGNWQAAHKIVDGREDAMAKWIHAYLHRKEGDQWNAAYWYRQAGRSMTTISLADEHQEIVEHVIQSTA